MAVENRRDEHMIPPQQSSQQWRVVVLVSFVTGVAYLVRTDVAVAQERMVPALGITMAAMGAITAWGFQLPYAVFQIPGGMFGERFGARAALALALGGCGAASLLTAALPADGAVAVLAATRVLLGISQAAVFPVAAMAIHQHVPPTARVRAMAIFIATSACGAAVAPLLMAPVMEYFNWRAVFALSSVIAGLTALVWLTLMPGATPQSTIAVSAQKGSAWPELRELLRDSRLRRLSCAYVLHSAVYFVFLFWFFRYLVEGRGFTILASGVWGSLPSVAGIVLAPLVGLATDRLGRRIGSSQARRRVAVACLLCAAGFVIAGAALPSAILAVFALSLSSGCINGAEAPFFSTATAIGGKSSGAAAGVLNFMGNLGGVMSIWLVPLMSASWGWNGTLLFWSGACVVAALLWLTVDTDESSVRQRVGAAAV
jgi:ACS family glucarate transporter-like MFS transporter